MTVKELIEKLQTEYQPDEKVAYTIWSWRDLEDAMQPDDYSEETAKRIWSKIWLTFNDALEMQNPELRESLEWLIEEQL
jgi:hypothetical protein